MAYKLTLVDEENVVLETWTIACAGEKDVEQADYSWPMTYAATKLLGEEIDREISLNEDEL